jgi:hypothetical protein
MGRPYVEPAMRPGARRWRLEKAIQNAIDLLDAMDGDPDLEESNDAEAGSAEDESHHPADALRNYRGPGCPFSDGFGI